MAPKILPKFVQNLSPTAVHNKILSETIIILVTPKAGAKYDILFKKPEAGLLYTSSCLAPTLGVTKFIIVTDIILVTLCCAT